MIIAVVVQALWGLGRTAVKNVMLGAFGVAVFAGYLLGVNVIVLLFGAALLIMLIENARRIRGARLSMNALVRSGVKATALRSRSRRARPSPTARSGSSSLS